MGSRRWMMASLSRYAVSSRRTHKNSTKEEERIPREKEGGKDFSSPRPSAAAWPRGRRGTPGSPRRCAGSRRTPSGPRRSRAGRRRTSARGPPCSRPARRPIVVASPSKALRRWRRVDGVEGHRHAIDAAYDRGRRNKRSMCRDVRPGGRSMRWMSVLEMTCAGGIASMAYGRVAVPPRTPSPRRRKVGRRAQTPSGIILK